MLSVTQAETTILSLTQPLNSDLDQESVDLHQADQRILAAAITGDRDFPYWDNSAMDGYAVRHADLGECTPDHPTVLEVVMEIPAGVSPSQGLGAGQAARIFTGAMMPPGADTVVMQEHTQREGNQVQIWERSPPQAYVRPRGDYYRAGAPLLARGTQLQAPEIAVLATVQRTQVPVYRQPVVAILSTGNELIAPDQPLQPGQIVDSNRYALATLVRQTGAAVIWMERVGDRPADLRAAIAEAITKADLVISSGGVSVGDYDYVDQVLADLGAQIHLRSVAIRPGKPLTFATFASQADRSRPILYFGLPGNPASVLVSFWRFVQPALRKLSGLAENWGPLFIQARTTQVLRSGGQRETYLWGQLTVVAGAYEFSLAGGKNSSGNLINWVGTNGLAVLKGDRPEVAAGETVLVLQVGVPNPGLFPVRETERTQPRS
jgi:molybdopterin molybdotransferase